MTHALEKWAADRGYLVAWGPAALAALARQEVVHLASSGQLDEQLCSKALGSLTAAATAPVSGLDTVVVVVRPRPAHLVSFELDGKLVEAVIPPTYVRYRRLFEEVRTDLEANALPGARLELLTAPLKPLAARLRLVRYGRNNITYAPGLGSYIQLLGYLTDAVLPLPEGWQPGEPELLPECTSCGVCASLCPTGAIGEDRVLLHGERCLTFCNEMAGPWPDWLPADAHGWLVGCLHCQRACPANPALLVEDSGVCFDPDETRALLDDTGDHGAPVWDGIRAKFERLGQPLFEPILGRNLKALASALA